MVFYFEDIRIPSGWSFVFLRGAGGVVGGGCGVGWCWVEELFKGSFGPIAIPFIMTNLFNMLLFLCFNNNGKLLIGMFIFYECFDAFNNS